MADRPVRQTGKDRDGDITSLADGGQRWSPIPKWRAIQDIENGSHTYYVPWLSGRTEIRVITTATGAKHLRTDRDATTRNNLEDLPNP